MPTPLRTPRINNNDDTVRLSQILVETGANVRAGDPVAEVETDKATFTVEAEQDCYILSIHGQTGDILDVGSILMWVGESADETPPNASGESQPSQNGTPAHAAEPSLKASILLSRYGLDASKIPYSGLRLSAAEVEIYAARHGLHPAAHPPSAPAAAIVSKPHAAGKMERLSPEQRGMLRTVSWHRDEAVPGYIEFSYTPEAWIEYAAAFQKTHKLLMNPLLALLAWRLAQIASEEPQLNSTIAGEQKYIYDAVNLGFTVQSECTLYLAVVENAAPMQAREFVDRLGELQRAALKNSLKPQESSGSTIAFTSMARWKVSRHIPVLPPHNSMIVAHTAASPAGTFLGATYDHRVLSGADIVRTLQNLSKPPENS